MRFNNARLISLIISATTVVLSGGCHCRFSTKVGNTIEAFKLERDEARTPAGACWRIARGLTQLQNSKKAIRTSGVIYYAVYATNRRDKKCLEIGYLSDDFRVSEIRILRDEIVVATAKPTCREVWSRSEKYFVGFKELCEWDNTNAPIPEGSARGYRVVLVRGNGAIIGPAPILTDADVWKEISEQIVPDPEWQKTHPERYRMLRDNPDFDFHWFGK